MARKTKKRKTTKSRRLMRSASKKLAAWVRSQANRGRDDNYYYYAFGDDGYQTPHKTMKSALAWIKSNTQWGQGKIKDRRTGKVTVVAGRKKKNPVRVPATVTGKGTGWIKAKAVRVVKQGGRYKVEVKR